MERQCDLLPIARRRKHHQRQRGGEWIGSATYSLLCADDNAVVSRGHAVESSATYSLLRERENTVISRGQWR